MTHGKAGFLRELLGKRVADLELSDLCFLKSEAVKEYHPPHTRLDELFGVEADQHSVAAAPNRK
jgi:hypothetical protein